MDCYRKNISQLLQFMYKKKYTRTRTTKNIAGKERDATETAFLLYCITYMYVSLEILVTIWTDLQFCFLEKDEKLIDRIFQKQPLFHKILRF